MNVKIKYTDEEFLEILKVESKGTDIATESKRLGKKFDKPYRSIYNMMYRTRKAKQELNNETVKSNPKTMRSEVKTKGTVRFYTKEELALIEQDITLQIPLGKIAEKYAKKWNRSINGMYYKVVAIYNKLNPETAQARKIKTKVQPRVTEVKVVQQVALVQEMELQMSSGSTFDCKPSRVTICKDHIRIYF